MYNGLDYKAEKIAKLKEEFREIQAQFVKPTIAQKKASPSKTTMNISKSACKDSTLNDEHNNNTTIINESNHTLSKENDYYQRAQSMPR